LVNARSENPNISVVKNGLEVVELHGDGHYVVIPPSMGKTWREGRSIWDLPLADLPDPLMGILTSLSSDDAFLVSIKGNRPASITGDLPTSIRGNSPLMDTLLHPTDSPLVNELVYRLGGQGLRVPCPYHPTDRHPSGRFYCNGGFWVYTDFHTGFGDEDEPSEDTEEDFPPQRFQTIPVHQVVCDLLTGYPSRKRTRHSVRAGRKDEDGHFVPYKRWKLKPEAYIWLVLFAGETGLIRLPDSHSPNLNPADWQEDELRLLQFVFRWFPAKQLLFGNDEVPLARPWLCSVLDLDDGTVDKTLSKARRRGILERTQTGVKGYGGRPAMYRLGGSE